MTRPYRLVESLRPARLGSSDPTVVIREDTFVKAFWTPQGACTLALRQQGPQIQAEAVGPGADWTAERIPSMLSLDRPQELPPGAHPAVRARARRHPGLRVTPTLWPGDLLAGTILQQRVSWRDAARVYRRLIDRHGEAAPGPLNLRLPLSGPQWAALGPDRLQAHGLDLKRATTLLRVAPYLARLDSLPGTAPGVAWRDLLERLPGVGPWTIGMVLGLGAGDPDAVPLGDLHLPLRVGELLDGRPADDQRMLELLEPYRGLRFRVLLWLNQD